MSALKNAFDFLERKIEEMLGKLPEGFFVIIDGSQCCLFYKGPGYQQIIQPGGGVSQGEDVYISRHRINIYTMLNTCCHVWCDIQSTKEQLKLIGVTG